jgi:hypothetical protein
MSRIHFSLLLTVLLVGLAPTALASTTWYVNGVNGSDSHICKSATVPCKTIGHAITLASSGDSINIAAATYTENLTIGKSLSLTGTAASTNALPRAFAGVSGRTQGHLGPLRATRAAGNGPPNSPTSGKRVERGCPRPAGELAPIARRHGLRAACF